MNDEEIETSQADETTAQPGSESPSAAPNTTASQSAEFTNLENSQGTGARILEAETVQHIPVTLSVEVGRSGISIQELLQLNQGSVVQLDRAAGEPMDIRINGCLMAHGEVVVINDQFGVRLTSIVSPAQRANRLS